MNCPICNSPNTQANVSGDRHYCRDCSFAQPPEVFARLVENARLAQSVAKIQEALEPTDLLTVVFHPDKYIAHHRKQGPKGGRLFSGPSITEALIRLGEEWRRVLPTA